MDVHAASVVVVRMVEGAKPQPPQTFKPEAFLEWVKKWKLILLNPKAHRRARKRAIIAFAANCSSTCGAGKQADAPPNNWAGL